MSPNIMVIVPARGGSKRLPGKNLLEIGGKSLFVRIDDVVSQANLGAQIFLTTDDRSMAAAGERLGWVVPFLRPDELATDNATTTDAILHLLDWHLAQAKKDPQIVMVLQPTSPYRRAESLINAVERLRIDPSIDSVVGMCAIHRPIHGVFVIDEESTAVSVAEGDSRSPFYVSNGALFAIRTTAFRREKSLYAGRMVPLVMDQKQSQDIDTEDDLKFVNALLDTDIKPRACRAEPTKN
jgi:CMP-N,N'-diacetyllegionaminic acid synthase